MKVMIFTRRRLAVLTSCLAAGLLVAVLAAQGLSVVTAASRKLLPVYSVETAEKKACLTFDAAWGIGLYLAREIVTRQGGYIKVVSEPGKGSEFSIMLPTK